MCNVKSQHASESLQATSSHCGEAKVPPGEFQKCRWGALKAPVWKRRWCWMVTSIRVAQTREQQKKKINKTNLSPARSPFCFALRSICLHCRNTHAHRDTRGVFHSGWCPLCLLHTTAGFSLGREELSFFDCKCSSK